MFFQIVSKAHGWYSVLTSETGRGESCWKPTKNSIIYSRPLSQSSLWIIRRDLTSIQTRLRVNNIILVGTISRYTDAGRQCYYEYVYLREPSGNLSKRLIVEDRSEKVSDERKPMCDCCPAMIIIRIINVSISFTL